MSEVVQYEQRAAVATVDPTGGRLVAWAQAAGAAHQLALSLCKTTFVPDSMRNNPGDATAAILMGDELGLSPLAALRSIYVVHGTPAMYARTVVALAQAHGHEVWTVESTPVRAVVRGRRAGSEHVEESIWTMDRARKAGYTTSKSGKTTKWDTDPTVMLYARAASEVCRKIASDVLAGCPYSAEEIEDETVQTTTVTRTDPAGATAKTQTVKRKPPAARPAPDEPPLEPAPTPDPGPEPVDVTDAEVVDDATDEPSITAPQMRKLHAMLREMWGGDREAALATCSAVLGHDLASTKDLSVTEASTLIDALEADRAQSQDWPEVAPVGGETDG